MALAVLDGNQTATTLSSVITGGEHIVAHSVVSLGSDAISNITSAVSGTVVSISNFPASQSTTFGAVTGSVSILNFPAIQSVTFGQTTVTGQVELGPTSLNALESITVTVGQVTVTGGLTNSELRASALTIDGVVSISGTASVTFSQASVTFGAVTGSVSVLNFPSTQTIAGTVTANVENLFGSTEIYLTDADTDIKFSSANPFPISGTVTASNLPTLNYDDNAVTSVVAVKIANDSGAILGSNPLPSLGYGANVNGGYNALAVANYGESFLTDSTRLGVQLLGTNGEAVGEGSSPLLISGTVTANLPLGDSYVYLVNGDNDSVVGASNPIPVTGSVSVGNISADGGQTFEGFLSVKVDPDYYQVGLDRITPEITVTNLVNTGNFTTRFGTPTTANTVFATSAVTNGQRKYLLIQNVTTGSNVITVGIGFTPTTTQGIQLAAGAGITFESSYIPTGQVFVLSSVTASNFTILEG